MNKSKLRIAAIEILGRFEHRIGEWLEEAEAEVEAAAAQAGSASHARSTRTRPQLERAITVLNEMFPSGIPDQSTLPNRHLCKQVAEALEERVLASVSPETIKRAAGRRTKSK